MGLGLAGYIMKEEAKDYLQQRLPLTMMKYDTSADIRSAWDALQNTVRNFKFHVLSLSYIDRPNVLSS